MSLFAAELEELKIGMSGKGLTMYILDKGQITTHISLELIWLSTLFINMT